MTREEKCKLAIEKGFIYNSETGKVYSNRGKEITRRDKGYIIIQLSLNKKAYVLKGHQFAWYYMYKEVVETIDHINRIKDDNRICNLRSISQREQSFNTTAKGYSWNKIARKWVSEIQVNGKKIYLGHFELEREEDARNAYLKAREIYHKIG